MVLATFSSLDSESPNEFERKCAFKCLGVVQQLIEREIVERQKTMNLIATLEYFGKKWRKRGKNIMDDPNSHYEKIIQDKLISKKLEK